MSDRFFTLMVVPEKSDRVRKVTLPTLYLRLGSIAALLLVFAGLFIFFDYLHVLSEVAENKRLKVENNLLKLDVQNAKNRIDALDQSVNRLKSFAHKLRVIGNLEGPSAAKALRSPEPATPGAPVTPDSEEGGGSIEDPDHSSSYKPGPPGPEADIDTQLEYQRSLTVSGELGQQFDSKPLIDQVAQISMVAAKLREEAETEEQNFAQLQELFQDKVDRFLSTPSLMPAKGYLSSEFGYRFNPFSGTRTFHAGTDISNSIGTSIMAPADGLVTFTGASGGFGQIVRIDHGYNLVTKYGHTSKIVVHKGDRVKRGEKIAEIGNTGRSTGPHLHYQVELKGRPVNPRYFMLEDSF